MKRRKQVTLFIIFIIAMLLGMRIYLPYWATDYINKQINALPGYSGQVQDVDIHLWRGAYQIHGIEIHKTSGGIKKPFFLADTADLSIEWRALLHGGIVAEIDLYETELNFSSGQTGSGVNWAKFVDALSPLDINRFDIHSGRIAYINYAFDPDVNIYIEDINAQVTNLRQLENKGQTLPSDLKISGTSIGGGDMEITGKMDILRDLPDFDLNGKLENASLPAFNSYAQSFAGVDFESGNIGIYAELAASNGNVVGYIKPVATNVTMINIETQDTNLFDVIWESAVSVFTELFENQSQDQFAVRLPIEGNFKDMQSDGWAAFFSIFENAFDKAFTHDTDGNITFSDAVESN